MKNFYKRKVIWIAWERHIRTITICNYLDIDPIMFVSALPRFIKHPYFILKTFLVLAKYKPKNLIIQNPSIVLALEACLLGRYFNYKLIVDAHNGGIMPDDVTSTLLQNIYKYVQQSADITIVSNKYLGSIVRKNKGNPFILPDKLPNLKKYNKNVNGRIKIVYICTFSPDDPYLTVLKACKLLPDGISVFFTGNYQKSKVRRKKIPDNVILTGFLSDQKYWDLLKTADLIIDLTTRRDCLVCGAYEAVSTETPIVLSNSRVLREFFNKGAVFTELEASELARAIIKGIEKKEELQLDIKKLKNELNSKWEVSGKYFQELLM